jgi:hypothetical protein
VTGAVFLAALAMLVAQAWLIIDKGKFVVIDVKATTAGKAVLGVVLVVVAILLLCLYLALLTQDADDWGVEARAQRAIDEARDIEEGGVVVQSTAKPIPDRPPSYRAYQLIPAVVVLALVIATATKPL